MNWIQTLWSDRLVRAGWLIALIAIIAQIAALKWLLDPGAQAQALHYNIYFGVDLFGPGYAFWLNPIVSAGVLIVNCLIAVLAAERQLIAARLSTWAAALFSLVVLAGTLLVWFVTGRP